MGAADKLLTFNYRNLELNYLFNNCNIKWRHLKAFAAKRAGIIILIIRCSCDCYLATQLRERSQLINTPGEEI